MPTPAALMTTKPAAGAGFPIGLGDWRLAVEIMLPESLTSRWGAAVWGTDPWSGFAWYDLSAFVRGLAWQRGTTEFDGNPEIGEAQITLDNRTREFSPWNTVTSYRGTVLPPVLPIIGGSYAWGTGIWGTALWGGPMPFAAALQPGFLGLLVRVVAHSPSGMVNPLTDPATLLPASADSWVPQFTGYIESTTDQMAGNGADSQTTFTLVETASVLAQTDSGALPYVQGDGDLPGARIARLANAAGWQLGYTDTFTYDYIGSAQYGLQSTDMARNRWGEIILTADSVGGVARTHRNGTITLYNRYRSGDRIGTGPEKAATLLAPGAYVADSATIVENTDNVINDVGLARAGGTIQRATDQVSEGAYKLRTHRRSDLICKSDPLILEHLIPRFLNARSLCSRRLERIELHSGQSLALIVAADIGDRLDVLLPPLGAQNPRANDCTLDALAHTVTVTAHGLAAWQTTVTFGAQSAFT